MHDKSLDWFVDLMTALFIVAMLVLGGVAIYLSRQRLKRILAHEKKQKEIWAKYDLKNEK